jgi:glucan biosynthesis protein C
MSAAHRRYDIDWLRVIAIGLLLLYHIAIGFQRWGVMVGFITNQKSWESLWIPMSMLNIWRIPLLFFVSGMGVYFAMRNRNWKQLLLMRAGRILLPFLFGMFLIVPVSTFLWQYYYHLVPIYSPNPGHLWFLGNIFVYVVVLSPAFFYLKRYEDGQTAKWIKRILSHPTGLLAVMAAFVAEAVIIRPNPYVLYGMTWHGLFMGLLAFFCGFCFVFTGRPFWAMILTWRWLFLGGGALLFMLRLVQFQLKVPAYLLAIESECWVFSILGFGHRYLNHPGKMLRYVSEAAYPVYILHMIFLFLGSALIFPLDMAAPIQFILVLLFTGTGCFTVYELIIRRVNFLRLLFGMKKNHGTSSHKGKSALIQGPLTNSL